MNTFLEQADEFVGSVSTNEFSTVDQPTKDDDDLTKPL